MLRELSIGCGVQFSGKYLNGQVGHSARRPRNLESRAIGDPHVIIYTIMLAAIIASTCVQAT